MTLFSIDENTWTSKAELLETQQKISALEQEILLKQNAIQDLTNQLSHIRSNTDIDSMRRRETILKNRLNELHDAVAHESRQRVVERYVYTLHSCPQG